MTSISNIWKQLTTILSNLNNFHSLGVVDRVSETQLQVGENSDWIIWRLKGWILLLIWITWQVVLFCIYKKLSQRGVRSNVFNRYTIRQRQVISSSEFIRSLTEIAINTWKIVNRLVSLQFVTQLTLFTNLTHGEDYFFNNIRLFITRKP